MDKGLEEYLKIAPELEGFWEKIVNADLSPEDKTHMAQLVAAQVIGAAARLVKDLNPDAFRDDELPEMVTHLHTMVQRGLVAKASMEKPN